MESIWENDAVQFPRLIAELKMAGVFDNTKVVEDLCDSMDITHLELMQIVGRAQVFFNRLKGGS